MPAEFAGILGIVLGTPTITVGAAMVLVIFMLTFITGRTFCAHICPVGSIQELAYCTPVKKIRIRNSHPFETIRLVVVAGAVAAAFAGIDLISCLGTYDFFALALSVWAGVFVLFLILAAIVWRPVCRAICPFGLIFAAIAHFSRFRLQRTEACTGCKKCEKTCPAGVAGHDDPKRECYLCARCTQTCPVPGALMYGKRNA
jgi:polyferredoxin